MYTAERPPRELGTTTIPLALAERLLALQDQPTNARIRGLAGLCRQLSRQYRQAPETCLAHGWWRLFNQAGIGLREALDQARAEGYPGLSDRELEQAYFLLIHVAYFFEPEGIAETLWPLLPPESGDQQTSPPTNEALGVAFATPPPMPPGARMRLEIRRRVQYLGQRLSRSDARGRKRAELLARVTQHLPLLEEQRHLVP